MKPVAHSPMPATLAFLVLLCAVALTPFNSTAELVDRVVAVVNDDVITLSELEKEGEPLYRDISAKTPSASLADTLQDAREHVLDQLIEKRLVAQKAKAANLSVSDAEVNAAFEQMLAQNKVDRDGFLARLKSQGVTETAYKEDLRDQILQGKLVNTDVRSKVVVTEEEILDYYDTHYTSQASGDGYYLLQIGISWTDPQNPDTSAEVLRVNKLEAEKQAEKVLAMARDGEDFKDLARKYSTMPSADDGGDIGIFQLNEMAPYMRQAVQSLKPGEVSDLIDTPEGFQFFKLINSEDGTIVIKTPLEEVKDKIRNTLYEERLKEAYGTWLEKLKDQAYIQKL
jgi:peptidyl-prolyl cis-trans isomerase SurA